MTMQLVLPSGVTLRRRDAPADPADLPPHVRWRPAREDPNGPTTRSPSETQLEGPKAELQPFGTKLEAAWY